MESPFETDSVEEVDVLLDFMLWSTPTSMIPSHATVREWMAIFERRGPEFAGAVAACREWLEPE
jgi:hypothetical protein